MLRINGLGKAEAQDRTGIILSIALNDRDERETVKTRSLMMHNK